MRVSVIIPTCNEALVIGRVLADLPWNVSCHPLIGESKISGTLRGTVGAAWFILSLIARYYFQRRRIGARQPV